MTICPSLTHPCRLTVQTHIHNRSNASHLVLLFQRTFLYTPHQPHRHYTNNTLLLCTSFYYGPGITFFNFHAQKDELYYQYTFSKVNYFLKSSRLQIFIHKYLSWFRTIKISKIGESLLSRMSKMKHIT